MFKGVCWMRKTPESEWRHHTPLTIHKNEETVNYPSAKLHLVKDTRFWSRIGQEAPSQLDIIIHLYYLSISPSLFVSLCSSLSLSLIPYGSVPLSLFHRHSCTWILIPHTHTYAYTHTHTHERDQNIQHAETDILIRLRWTGDRTFAVVE